MSTVVVLLGLLLDGMLMVWYVEMGKKRVAKAVRESKMTSKKPKKVEPTCMNQNVDIASTCLVHCRDSTVRSTVFCRRRSGSVRQPISVMRRITDYISNLNGYRYVPLFIHHHMMY